jgi:glutathione S-transferase
MKLFFSPASPYVRKVVVVAHELGITDKIERLPSAAHPVNRDQTIIQQNPIGKVPTLVTDDGLALYDSRVICEYVAAQVPGSTIFPATGRMRWVALAEQALGDGLLDAALLARYETAVRPAEFKWAGWLDGQLDKVNTCLAAIERSDFGSRLDIGTITIGCALGYLDFRFPDLNWRAKHPKAKAWFAVFGERPSMQATRPS